MRSTSEKKVFTPKTNKKKYTNCVVKMCQQDEIDENLRRGDARAHAIKFFGEKKTFDRIEKRINIVLFGLFGIKNKKMTKSCIIQILTLRCASAANPDLVARLQAIFITKYTIIMCNCINRG